MSTELVRLNKNDYNDALDLINLVFSQASHSHDFLQLLPKGYKETDESMSCQYAIKENGKIKAMAGSFPMAFQIGDETLKMYGIGNVAVHKYCRSKGYMVDVMKAAIDDIKNSGCDLSYLGGYRNRYQHFGYEKCGFYYRFGISFENVKHLASKNFASKFNFIPMDDISGEDLQRLYNLYCSKKIKMERKQDEFIDVLKSWNFVPLAIYDLSDNLIGYIAVSNNKDAVHEVVLFDMNLLRDVLFSHLVVCGLKYISIIAQGYEPELTRQLNVFCEDFAIEYGGSYMVLNFERVVKALLKAKASCVPLLDGEVKIGIDHYGTIKITVNQNKISVLKTEEESDVFCKDMTAYNLFFGPLPAYSTQENSEFSLLFNSWFPLPLSIPRQDAI